MTVLHTILKVQKVDSFCVTCLWNTGEIRITDFAALLKDQRNNKRLEKLNNPVLFQDIKAVDGTLQWPQILVSGLSNGELIDQPLMLAPEVLYNNSTLMGISLPAAASFQLRQARLGAGMSQSAVAQRSGTTKEHISRIESGKADFNIATYDRILQQGLNIHFSELTLK